MSSWAGGFADCDHLCICAAGLYSMCFDTACGRKGGGSDAVMFGRAEIGKHIFQTVIKS